MVRKKENVRLLEAAHGQREAGDVGNGRRLRDKASIRLSQVFLDSYLLKTLLLHSFCRVGRLCEAPALLQLQISETATRITGVSL